MSQCKALLIDLGGVLVDLGTPAADMALPMSDAAFWSIWLGSPHVRAYETGRMGSAEFCARIAKDLSYDQFTPRHLERWRLPLFPRAEAVLSRLARHQPLALLSNTNAIHWASVTAQTDVFARFSHCLLSYELGLHKPDRAFFEHALSVLAVPPRDILFIDDAAQNVAAARACGMDAHCASGFAQAERLLCAAFGADSVAPSADSD